MATKAKKRMTQSEVINHFAESAGMKRAQVKEFFEELSNLAAREVKSNGEFVLPGFGKLVTWLKLAPKSVLFQRP